jgi:hypothetical protein
VKERHHLEDTGGDGMILKGSFNRMEECGMDPFGSGGDLWQDIANIIINLSVSQKVQNFL